MPTPKRHHYIYPTVPGKPAEFVWHPGKRSQCSICMTAAPVTQGPLKTDVMVEKGNPNVAANSHANGA
jgi:hypothetical protein